MSTIEKIKELKAVCAECGLDDDGLLAKYTDEELAATYNGIGPEAFPAWLRSVIDALHPSLEPVALIHDVEWSQEDKSTARFMASNARFKQNGYKVAKAKFAWWNPAATPS